MAVFLTLGYSEERDPSPARLREVLARMEVFEGEEGFGVSLTCARTVWSLYTDRTELAVWMNLNYTFHGRGQPRHMRGVIREHMLTMWELLSKGRLDEIEREPWFPGDGHQAEPLSGTPNLKQ